MLPQTKEEEFILSLTVTHCENHKTKTLPKVYNRDLTLIQHPIRLHSSKDLAEITELAQGRKRWRGLTSQIKRAAEVPQKKNWDVTPQ